MTTKKAAHNDPTWVAFADVMYQKIRWTITLREGADPAEALQTIEEAHRLMRLSNGKAEAGKANYGLPPLEDPPKRQKPKQQTAPPKPEPKKEQQPQAPTRQEQGPDVPSEHVPDPTKQKHGVLSIGKIKVGGTEDAPQIEFFSTNAKLKHMVLYAPAKIVQDMLVDGYPSVYSEDGEQPQALPMLAQVGKVIEGLEWHVHWRASEKTNSKGVPYKDLAGISIPRYGPAAWEVTE